MNKAPNKCHRTTTKTEQFPAVSIMQKKNALIWWLFKVVLICCSKDIAWLIVFFPKRSSKDKKLKLYWENRWEKLFRLECKQKRLCSSIVIKTPLKLALQMVVLLHQRTLDWLCRFKHNSESQKSLANETPELRRRTQGELGMPMYHNWPHLVLIHQPSIHSKTKLLHFIVQWSESTLCQRKPHVASVVMLTVLFTHTHRRAHMLTHPTQERTISHTHCRIKETCWSQVSWSISPIWDGEKHSACQDGWQ